MGMRVGTDELLDVDDGLEFVERHEREVVSAENSLLLNVQEGIGTLVSDVVELQKARVGAAARASHAAQLPLPEDILRQDIKRCAPAGGAIWEDNARLVRAFPDVPESKRPR